MADEIVGATCARYLRLTGEIDGKPVTFDLGEGEHTVGALDSVDVLLPVGAVSRRHAVLRVGEGTYEVEDAGSKNGTFVNGTRVDRAELHVGDWIGFGPATLYVGEVDRDDAELAIPLDRRSEAGSDGDQETETKVRVRRMEDEPPRWVSLLNRLIDILVGAEDPDPTVALAALRDGLDAEGAYVVEWAGKGEPVVLCAAGETFALPTEARMRGSFAAVAEAGEIEPVVLSGAGEGNTPLSWAAAAAPGVSPCGLIVGGRFPHWAAAGPLLEATLRLLLHARAKPAHLEINVEPQRPPDLRFPPEFVTGGSPAMRSVYDQLRQLLRGDLPVLITGETGVGKELIARLLHASSDRRQGPFVAVNCASIPSELLEAELFGIERGVATGVDARKGKFQLAEGGILFLDEIADMSADLQAKLLRAVQEMEVSPLGARRPVPVDVRVISATNANLDKQMSSGKFRRDLYFRIAGFTLNVPPLRERREDIPALVEHFMRRYAGEIGKPIRGITVKALRALTEASWPGNVRELEHEVRRLVYLCPETHAIDSHRLSENVLHPTVRLDLDSLDLSSDLHLESHVADVERKLIAVALARTRGNPEPQAFFEGVRFVGMFLAHSCSRKAGASVGNLS